MPDAMTPLDLDAIRVRADARRDYADERPESLHVHEDYAALADESAADVLGLVEEVERLRSESQQFYENRNLWQKRAEKAEAEVARLTARPAPAWDEEVVVEAVATALHGDGCPEDPDEGESCACSDYLREARIAVAVVREHLPVKPGREDMVEAMLGSDIITDDLRAEASAPGSTQREPFLCFADAILDLWPGRSEAEVKAEALRDAADAMDTDQGVRDPLRLRSDWLRARADRLAAEGGADRG